MSERCVAELTHFRNGCNAQLLRNVKHMMTTPSTPMNRRRALKTLFCSSAALALNLRPGAVHAAEAGDLNLLMIGDFGSNLSPQTAVAKAMATYLKKHAIQPEALLLAGDNFYNAMEGGLKSERWKTGFEDMYPASVFPGPCYAVLGNHDYHDNKDGEQTQLGYAKQGGTRWTMPDKWYRVDLGPQDSPLATMIFIDTNLPEISGGPYREDKEKKPRASLTAQEEAAQWDWLQAELSKPRAPFTVVTGHHPVYSNGSHGDTEALVQKLDPILQEHGVHLYLCGHDHDLQHLELEGRRTSYVLSGGGGARVRDLKNLERKVPYAVPIYGFSHLRISRERIMVTHIDANGNEQHSFEKRADFSWKPV
jgi:tartrate-resistant acid phosphatase type 5